MALQRRRQSVGHRGGRPDRPRSRFAASHGHGPDSRSYPIDVTSDGIDLTGFTDHKGLCGPMGTGGLIIGDRVDVDRLGHRGDPRAGIGFTHLTKGSKTTRMDKVMSRWATACFLHLYKPVVPLLGVGEVRHCQCLQHIVVCAGFAPKSSHLRRTSSVPTLYGGTNYKPETGKGGRSATR